MDYEAVIGLEIHAELNTKTKMFCDSLNDPDERHPNTNICPVCMGHPGTIPVANRAAVEKVIMVGLALGGIVPAYAQFDRKNYFYPDLPKGYQISQYEHPFVQGGFLALPTRRINITRVHLEEDTGRLAHDSTTGMTLVDFNRAGVPLMELVTEADFRTGEEVRQFGEALQQILRYVNASDANMEKGQMRVEVNISLRPVGTEKFGTKVEVKNINSFKFAADAVAFETKRQRRLLAAGERVAQETRGWNEHTGESFSQRVKEDAHDYRYFPEPDLPSMRISRELVAELAARLPELPRAKEERFMREYGLEPSVAELLARDKKFAAYFEQAASEILRHDRDTPERPQGALYRMAAAMMIGDLAHLLKETGAAADETSMTPENFAELVVLTGEEKITGAAAKEVLAEMFRSAGDPSDIIHSRGLWQISGVDALEDMARRAIKENPAAVADYRKGKAASLQFIVGQMMRSSRGTANPQVAYKMVKKILG